MSKVSEYFNNSLNGDEPCCSSIMEKGNCECGPSDEELMEIESKIDQISWEDVNWE